MARMALLLIGLFFSISSVAETWVTINQQPLQLSRKTSCAWTAGYNYQALCDCCIVKNVDVLGRTPVDAVLTCRKIKRCVLNIPPAQVLEGARSRLKSMNIAKIRSDNEALKGVNDGVLLPEHVMGIMRHLHGNGLLHLPSELFSDASKSDVTLIIKPLGGAKGVFSGQLFFIAYQKNTVDGADKTPLKPTPLYILKETKKGMSEISNLYRVNVSRLGNERVDTYEKHFGVLERRSNTIAKIAFDDLHFKLTSKDAKPRYFSLLQTAPGQSFNKHLRDFGEIAKSPETSDEEFEIATKNMHRTFYQLGYGLSELHQRYADKDHNRKKPLRRTFVHGDLHSENIFFDEKTRTVTLIDNETFALSLDRPSYGVDDVAEFYMLHTVKTIAHTVSSQLTTNYQFGIDDGLWHQFWGSFFDGYLEAYGELSEKDAKALFYDFKDQFYKCLSESRIFRSPRNFADQRKLKRFGPSWRRRTIKTEELADTFDALYKKRMSRYAIN